MIDDIFKPHPSQSISKRSKPEFNDCEDETNTMSGSNDLKKILAAMSGLKNELKNEIQTQLGGINTRVTPSNQPHPPQSVNCQ